MNLANLGITGLFAAQKRMQVTGHNINNIDTAGYNRQSVLVETAGSVGSGNGYYGRGVQVVTVQRSYDNFLYQQLVRSQTTGAALVSYGTEIAQLDNLFSDRTVGVSPALQNFFNGLEAVASQPADPSARQELLGRAESLATQIRDATSYMNRVNENINTQVGTTVTQINSYLERIDNVNKQIVAAKGTTPGHEPNDLLDQREQLVSELGQLIDVRTVEQDGRMSITTAGGQMLLGGESIYPLHAVRSAENPERMVVGFTSALNVDGKMVVSEFREGTIKGGTLGGLLQFRQESLEPAINALGRLAVGLAHTVNDIHRQGVDLKGEAGKDMFSVSGPKVIANGNNPVSSGVPGVSFYKDPVDPADPSKGYTQPVDKLTGDNYRIERVDGRFQLRNLSSNDVTPLNGPDKNGGITRVDGLEIDVSGLKTQSQDGDSWLLQPTVNAGSSLQVEIKRPQDIAAADKDTGSANGAIAQKLADLRNSKVLADGSLSLNDSFGQIVNRIAVQTQQNGTAAKAQLKLIEQNYAAQQTLSGVNKDEEYIMLQRYQEQYQAAARLIDVSSQMFDTLLGLRS
ncbi:flagellar hook-associated protein FlgK [Alcaligenes nematophilus]|jgi:flagellar hook-associated protein 1 FlgK|uniref:Flagellar hook-associated protein 1 n=3 Tax=Alcaligenes TaxID=507 RepID=A0AAE9KMK4_ALCFA|nr:MULTISPECIES: flagellar hook-associated protein FlgK [Alcaligenes]MDH4867147.1 flagellar hook-associated protein FlgK [Bacillus cereus]EKU30213.1 flagellar hook-associated protein FlgK [Alcaligenes sp. HPC1271]ERI35055.1 flagellar hook-associated protein FlgK [Alcaligenes sp. EGD-AK7]KGP02472.1 flagellar hook protein FlgK [Alcaligenes faecalis]MCB4323186.1 flagellar hook-associated protein FlgK [Alcaligenes sp. 13f]